MLRQLCLHVIECGPAAAANSGSVKQTGISCSQALQALCDKSSAIEAVAQRSVCTYPPQSQLLYCIDYVSISAWS